MGKRIWGMAALAAAGCSQAAAPNAANGTAVTAAPPAPAAAKAAAPAAAARGVDDPRGFVERTYRNYMRGPDAPIEWPAFAYSDRLKALFDDYDRWQHQHQDEVGSLDFDWWINAQDWELSDVVVTDRPDGADRTTEIARFRNSGSAEEIHFLFVRQNGRWYLDDVVQGSGHGEDGWTLSALLRARE